MYLVHTLICKVQLPKPQIAKVIVIKNIVTSLMNDNKNMFVETSEGSIPTVAFSNSKLTSRMYLWGSDRCVVSTLCLSFYLQSAFSLFPSYQGVNFHINATLFIVLALKTQ